MTRDVSDIAGASDIAGQSDIAGLADLLRARLAAQGTPERAEGERRYLKSPLTHLGVRVPVLRATTRQVLRGRNLAPDARVDLVIRLWEAGIYELRRAAVEVLAGAATQLAPADLALVDRLVRDAGTWALVDPLAIDVAGAIALADANADADSDGRDAPTVDALPDANADGDGRDALTVDALAAPSGAAADPATTFTRWIDDDLFWVRRTALLAHLPMLRADPARFARFAPLSDRVLDEREFFIRKAIGWVLRDVGGRAPQLVVAWLEPRTSRASGVTMREAVKRLPAADAARLMDAYRAHR